LRSSRRCLPARARPDHDRPRPRRLRARTTGGAPRLARPGTHRFFVSALQRAAAPRPGWSRSGARREVAQPAQLPAHSEDPSPTRASLLRSRAAAARSRGRAPLRPQGRPLPEGLDIAQRTQRLRRPPGTAAEEARSGTWATTPPWWTGLSRLQREIEVMHRQYPGPTVVEANSVGHAPDPELRLPTSALIEHKTTQHRSHAMLTSSSSCSSSGR